ncbi:hypothetical protein HELRODRAFT_87639 [Helobdella robusta]|uniref:Programmed cell death protein 10 dimerisation domain-containing protein n=1 Tax=Helobdella robusta TaxID=6412 RepID=T1G6T4_HELRO|nr:hypothetical protein HELRODRAFT_87639 [Helobdella robusta]ESN94827.1 hypothetical protein HELRODRAFT_87639 [Helobdella robusta]
MTMGNEEELFSSMALPVVVRPILDKMEKKNAVAANALKSGFAKVESAHPGFTYQLIKSILKKAEVDNQVDMCECLLRIEGSNNSNEFLVDRVEEPIQLLNERSTNLKKILSRIPDEIYDRKKFLETIKEIASAIRLLLDSVNSIFSYISEQYRQVLDIRKKEFVKYSRNFSNTLKDFFRDSEKQNVFLSANHLVNQSNLLMRTIKEALV